MPNAHPLERPRAKRSIVVRRRFEKLAMRLRGYPTIKSQVARGLNLGKNVYIGDRVFLDQGFLSLITVGDDSLIASGTRVLAHDASTKQHLGYTVVKPVSIGKRVYVGVESIILPGVTIGDDAIVGAGSVVTRDVEAGTVVAGNPAKPIGTTDSHIARHREEMSDHDVSDAREGRARANSGFGPRYVE